MLVMLLSFESQLKYSNANSTITIDVADLKLSFLIRTKLTH